MSDPTSGASSSENLRNAHVIQFDSTHEIEDGITDDEPTAEATPSLEDTTTDDDKKDLMFYRPMYNAAFVGDWKAFQRFIKLTNSPINVVIDFAGRTALHVAAYTRQTTFLKKLIGHEKMTPQMLAIQDGEGYTAFFRAVIAGDLETVKAMVNLNSDLPMIWVNEWFYMGQHDNNIVLPILKAALCGHKELLLYLYKISLDIEQVSGQKLYFVNPFRDVAGLKLLNALIAADFYDVAMDLVKLHPELATMKHDRMPTAVGVLANRFSSFRGGSKLGIWQQLIYFGIHVQPSGDIRSTGYLEEKKLDIEDFLMKDDSEEPILNIPGRAQTIRRIFTDWKQGAWTSRTNQVLRGFETFWDTIVSPVLLMFRMFWNTAILRVPCLKSVHMTKRMHQDAIGLVKCICEQLAKLKKYSDLEDMLNDPFLKAAECGNVDFLRVCLEYFPLLASHQSEEGRSLLHYCVINRQKELFKFLSHKSMRACLMSLATSNFDNITILHLAAKLAPAERLKTISGAALQMQSEIQWFKAVDQITPPSVREHKVKFPEMIRFQENESCEYKPRDLFLVKHEDLLGKGEKWMRGLASSCSVVAALIATMVFTAAFTVPGGNDQNKGIPMFLKNKFYMVFAISEALALMFSLTSVLIFLSALTSRYDAEDFIKSLPKKMIFGLATLFLSIASMATAFMATYFIMFSTHFAGVALFVALLISIPAILFAFSQFPLFIEVYTSTYGSGVIYEESEEIV